MRTTMRARAVWLVATMALLVALALSACGARGHYNSAGNSGYGGGQTTQQATQQNVDVQTTDHSVQDAIQSLNAAQNDANQDYSSQDTPVQP